MKPIRTLIVDDERLARAGVRIRIEAAGGFEVVGECSDGEQLAHAVAELRPELIFLDVEMPGLTGIEALHGLPSGARPIVVFVTAFDRYAVHAFDISALDYVLKPFDDSRFARTVERARLAVATRRVDELARSLDNVVSIADAGDEEAEQPLKRMLIREAGRISFLNTAAIDWIEAQGNDVTIHAGSAEHMARIPISSLEQKLDGSVFMRVHRSHIVNLDRVRELQPCGQGDYRVVMIDGTVLRVGRNYRKALLQRTL